MAKPNATIATANLNEGSGKTSPSKRKRTVDVGDIRFSPAKKPRTATGLKRKSLAQQDPTPTRQRRNSLSLPEDDIIAHEPEPEPTQKRVRKLKAKETADNPSPLKNMGFSPGEMVAPGRVNLNESPAKALRSRKAPMLPPKEDTTSAATQSATTPVKRPTRLSVQKGEVEAPPETWDKDQIPASSSRGDHAHVAEGRIDQGIQESAQDPPGPSNAGASSSAKQQLSRTPMVQKSKAKKTSGIPAAREKSAPQPNAAVGGPPMEPTSTDDRSQDQERRQRSKMPLANAELLQQKGDDEETRQRQGEGFVKNIESVASWYSCYDDWFSAGGAALIIKDNANGTEPESLKGKKIRKTLNKLTEICKAAMSTEADLTQALYRIAKRITGVDQICREIASVGEEPERKKIVKDLYTYTIADTLFALRKVMVLLTKLDQPQRNWVLEQFFHLLTVAEYLTHQAVSWKPRPSTLEGGVRERMRFQIRPQIRRIYERYNRSVANMQQTARLEKEMKELQAAQKQELEAHERRREEIYRRLSKQNSNNRVWQPVQQSTKDVLDIDDFVFELPLAEPVSWSIRDKEPQPPTPVSARPRLERQPTEDIVPAPMDWSEDEKAAFLNALEIYRGDDRFWQILKACDELKTRSIDDLRTAALYFKELVLSAPEFTGSAASRFSYLLSVE